jgi:hypothetical protein
LAPRASIIRVFSALSKNWDDVAAPKYICRIQKSKSVVVAHGRKGYSA